MSNSRKSAKPVASAPRLGGANSNATHTPHTSSKTMAESSPKRRAEQRAASNQ